MMQHVITLSRESNVHFIQVLISVEAGGRSRHRVTVIVLSEVYEMVLITCFIRNQFHVQ